MKAYRKIGEVSNKLICGLGTKEFKQNINLKAHAKQKINIPQKDKSVIISEVKVMAATLNMEKIMSRA